METILIFYFLLMENCSTLLHFTDIFVSIEMQQMIIYETFCNNKKTSLFFKFAHKVDNKNGRMLFYYWYLGIVVIDLEQVSLCKSLREKYPYLELFWSAFSRIQTENGELRSISPYSVRMRENVDQNNSEYGHFWRSEQQCFSFFEVMICSLIYSFQFLVYIQLLEIVIRGCTYYLSISSVFVMYRFSILLTVWFYYSYVFKFICCYFLWSSKKQRLWNLACINRIISM